ncbi:MAG: PD-(D/E)XK nuclease family protein [Thermodesulfobacteriota bacterium]
MNIKELIKKIKGGALVCASNRRLARHITAAYDSSIFLEGLKAWKTPGVTELGAWLSSLLTEGSQAGAAVALLTESRARSLFEEAILTEPEFSKEVHYKSALVRESFEAYLLLKEHKAGFTKNNIYLTHEASALKRWSLVYEKLLQEKGFICPSLAPFLVADRIESGEIKVEGELVLAGFEEISPALSSLIYALESAGVIITLWPEDFTEEGFDLEALVEGTELYAYSDMREEVVQAARWAREKATQGKTTGVIVANLSQYKELIEREFASELTPGSALLDGAGSVSETFNISMAAPISKSLLVSGALDLLSITEAARPVETELIWEIFGSPYLNLSMEEYLSLATMDAKLRRSNRSEVSLNALSNELSREEFASLKGFKKRVDSFIDVLRPKTKGSPKERPSKWAGRFFAELKAFGWPGSVDGLTSREFQAYEAFNALLAEFAGLDDIIPMLKRGEAASRLRRMADKSTHQPKSPETLIEVIGLNESIGFEFDSIRIIGATDEVLPQGIDPNPFIPISMQRELGFTRVSPELESKRAKIRLARLLKGAGEAVVSYPEINDNKEVRVSPFFSTLRKVESEKYRESNCLRDTLCVSSSLEDMDPPSVVIFAPKEMESLKGGTSILADQSACPFKAFASYRLGARVVESPEPGLSYMDRGTLLHSALKHFWEKVRDSEGLNKLISEDRLAVEVRLSVDKALEPYKKRSFGGVNFLNLETERLRRLLLDWLGFEATRASFVVDLKSLETEDCREISGLSVKFRIDRVDEIANLGHAVIDYKTGRCNRKDWLGSRPKDPQMLVYNLFGPYEALAFARVKFGECKFDGFAKSEGMLPGNNGFEGEKKIKTDLAADGIDTYEKLTDSWRKVVESLAKDFVDGVSVVDPYEWGSTRACIYCDLKPLCRIFEAVDSFGEEL